MHLLGIRAQPGCWWTWGHVAVATLPQLFCWAWDSLHSKHPEEIPKYISYNALCQTCKVHFPQHLLCECSLTMKCPSVLAEEADNHTSTDQYILQIYVYIELYIVYMNILFEYCIVILSMFLNCEKINIPLPNSTCRLFSISFCVVRN